MRPDKSRHNVYRHATPKQRYQPEVPSLGAFGMAVYRTVQEQHLTDATEAFEQATEGVVSEPRANGAAKNSLTLLERGEVKRHRALIGRIPIKTAIDSIFEAVPSLRRPAELQLGRVGIYGNDKSPFVSLGYSIVGDSLEVARQERLEIVTCLEGLVETEDLEQVFDWDHRAEPHITLGRVPTPLVRNPRTAAPVFDALREVMPETIAVVRATLFDPTSSQRPHMIA